MSPTLARPVLHAIHVVTFAVLLATGLLLLLPSLRAAVTGGYSLVIRQAHWWTGVAFAVLPICVLRLAGVGRVLVPTRKWSPRTVAQAVHTGVTVAMAVLFTVTGVVIWGKRALPDWVVDPARAVHDGLTYAVAALVLLHLAEVGLTALMSRVKVASGTEAGSQGIEEESR